MTAFAAVALLAAVEAVFLRRIPAEEGGVEKIRIESPKTMLTAAPAKGGETFEFAEKGSGLSARGAGETGSLDWRLETDWRTGLRTMWTGRPAGEGGVAWTAGFSYAPEGDGTRLRVRYVVSNRSGKPAAYALPFGAPACTGETARVECAHSGAAAEGVLAPYGAKRMECIWSFGKGDGGAGGAEPEAAGGAEEAGKRHEAARKACREGDWAKALAESEAALRAGGGGASAVNVVKAYALRKLGRPREASKALRMAAAADPLDAWHVAERAFLEEDAAEAVRAAAENRGDAAATFRALAADYASLGAAEESRTFRQR